MLGIFWFLFWQMCGIFISYAWFPDKRTAVRLWLGSTAGSVLSMWTPVPFAFFLGFTGSAHLCGAAVGVALLAGAVLLMRRRGPVAPAPGEDPVKDRPLWFLLPPFLTVCVVIVVTHTLREVDGALYTGQCTYGDLPMHLGFITSIAQQGFFPPLYSILPPEKLCYPFLCDSVSSSLYLLGTPLRLAYVIPMLAAFLQVFCGVWFLAREFVKNRGAAVLAFLLFFLNGGFGLIYFVKDYSFHDLMTGFYVTPTNLTEKGMRWVNVLVDMLVPQRATLFGWAALFAALYLLYRGVFRRDDQCFLPAGILGGLLPMIHTHSFFALGLMAASWLLYCLKRDGLTREFLRNWLRFGLTAVALAVPQLLLWTFQSVGGNASFLRFGFDWVNGGQENWFWFWLKNVGPVFLITPAALITAKSEQRNAFWGAVFIFVLCEFVVFQPNAYDNNKLLYIAYLFACFLSADAIMGWLARRSSPALRGLLLGALLLVCTNAAILSLAREVVSGYPQYGYVHFTADEVEAAGYVQENTQPDSLFLTCDNHNNAVAGLTGRNILCGSGSYLYYHGVDYTDAQQTAKAMLTDWQAFEENRQALGVDYVWIGRYERALPGVIVSYLEENYPLVFSSGSVLIFDVR